MYEFLHVTKALTICMSLYMCLRLSQFVSKSLCVSKALEICMSLYMCLRF